MQLKEKKLIIFDLDGTLIDSGADLALALNAMLLALKRETFSEETIHTWVGNGAQTLVRRALSGGVLIDERVDEELFNKALEIFLDSYKENVCVKTKAYEGVNATLQTLYKRGHTLAIITNKPYEFVRPILEKLNLESYFSLILGGDSLDEKKPSPKPLLYACSKLGISTQNAVMVGDSKNDILAAKSAGMASVGVSYGYNYGEDIATFEPEIVLDNFAKIAEI